MITAECPSCGLPVQLGSKPKMGQQVNCGACDTELEIVWLDPIELDWVYEDEEGDEDGGVDLPPVAGLRLVGVDGVHRVRTVQRCLADRLRP